MTSMPRKPNDNLVRRFARHPLDMHSHPGNRDVQLIIHQHIGLYEARVLNHEIGPQPSIDSTIWSNVQERAQ